MNTNDLRTVIRAMSKLQGAKQVLKRGGDFQLVRRI